MTPPSRRLPALGVLLLLAAVLLSLLPATTASAASSGGVSGAPRIDEGGISSTYYGSCAIVSSGGVRCWGDGDFGELAQGNSDSVGDDPGETTVPVDLGGHRATQVSGSGYSSCALLDSGTVRCWGYNASGELAQGNTHNIGDDPGETTVPVDLGPGRTAASISVGDTSACAVLDDGALRCWGANGYGQLAQGTTADIGDNPGETTVPVDLGPGRTAVAVSVGGYAACALLDTGTVSCWGYGGYGQLAQGDSDNVGDNVGETTVPVDLGPGHTAVAVSVGESDSCAILDTGALSCWGSGDNGMLAQGNTDAIGDDPGETTVPVDLGPGRTARTVSVGYYDSCAVLDTGAVRCWGANTDGELGQGNDDTIGDNTGESTVPLDLGPGHTAIAVVAGYDDVCAALDDRTLRCLGDNSYGQLAQGSTIDYGYNAGETGVGAGTVLLGGELFGSDTDGDGVRDAVDSCPTAAASTVSGCPSAPPAPAVTTPAAATTREAILRGRSVILAVHVVTKAPAGGCSGRVKVHVKTRTNRGPLHLVKKLKLSTVGSTCTASGKVRLPAKPRHSAAVRVTVAGQHIRKRTLHAVRQR